MNYPRRVEVDLTKNTLRVWTIKRGEEVEHLDVSFAPDKDNPDGIEVVVITPSDAPFELMTVTEDGVDMRLREGLVAESGDLLSNFRVGFEPLPEEEGDDDDA